MNGQTLVDILKTSRAATATELDELKAAILRYPYFNLGHLLYLKGLKVNNDSQFGQVLSRAAIYAQSSEWLYQFLSKTEQTVPEPLPDEVEPAPVDEIDEVEVEVQNEESATEEPAEAISEVVEEKSDEVAVSEEQEDEREKSLEPNGEDEEADFELLDEELSSEKDSLIEILDQKLYTLDEPKVTVDKQSDLIEQFLTINPRIVPKPDLPPVNEDISVESLKEDEEIVTEMLAKIYASQGLVAKAIDVYQKLCLKYPEKSAYFVAEVEKLQK